MSKAERLARELVALHARYSTRDFDAALELLSSGSLFERVGTVSRAARPARAAAAHGNGGSRRAAAQGPDAPAREKRGPAELVERLPGLEDVDRAELLAFAVRFADREVLGHAGTLRSFAQGLGLSMPRKLPSRSALLPTLLEALSRVPRSARARLISAADAPRGSESSLQGWSDLIVKHE